MFGEFLTNLFSPGETARGQELDRRRLELEQRRIDLGLITKEQADSAADHYANDSQEVLSGQVSDSFYEGAAEGLANEQKFVKGTINGVVGGALGFIPVWLKVAAIIGAIGFGFYWLGGFVWVRGILSRGK